MRFIIHLLYHFFEFKTLTSLVNFKSIISVKIPFFLLPILKAPIQLLLKFRRGDFPILTPVPHLALFAS